MKVKKILPALGLLCATASFSISTDSMAAVPSSIDAVQISTPYYITATSLNVRDADRNVLGMLTYNSKVAVISTDTPLGGDYVEVEIEDTSEIDPSSSYYVSYKYLNDVKQAEQKRVSEANAKYFVVQNIATERVRIYEKNCEDNVCANKMVFESEVAVGEYTPETMSIVGRFKITKWFKFYQDNAAHYPNWYTESLGLPPGPGSSAWTWTRSKYLRPGADGGMRGAFGWYAAHLGPDAHYQWMHGTIGWGKDKDTYIKDTKGFLANIFSDPRSAGCTRLNNEAIAYVRNMLPVGTPVFKVYAEEELYDSSLNGYSEIKKGWDYILSTDSRSVSDKYYVLENIDPSTYIEEGTFGVDTYPTVVTYKEKSKKTESGNTYDVPRSQMHGVFYIDIGMFDGYKHPRKITKGGYKNRTFPGYTNFENYADHLAQ